MFASIRRHRLLRGSMDDLEGRVDEDFAELLAAQGGFVSYEFLDCGEGEVTTITVFREAEEAEASRDLAQRWSAENLADLRFERIEARRGEILVSRARDQMLEPGHAGGSAGFASLQRYRLDRGSVAELMHIVDEDFADRISQLDGFVAYHALDCGDGEILSVSLFRDQATAEESDELAREFVRDKLGDLDIKRTEVIRGEVIVSRAMAEVLEPAHA